MKAITTENTRTHKPRLAPTTLMRDGFSFSRTHNADQQIQNKNKAAR